MDKETEQGIQQLQLLEQNLQNFLLQRQQFQAQLIEVDSALEELKDKKEAYKIIGNIMVKSSKTDLEKDLKKKKEILDLIFKVEEKRDILCYGKPQNKEIIQETINWARINQTKFMLISKLAEASLQSMNG